MKLNATILTPAPPPNGYDQLQVQVTGKGSQWDKQEVLRRIFRREFLLGGELNSHFAYDAQEAMRSYLGETGSELFDHVQVFKSGACDYLLVTQPYCEHTSDAWYLRELEHCGCLIWNLNAWAWHFPGHAFCYGIQFNRAAIQAMKCIVRARQSKHPFTLPT